MVRGEWESWVHKEAARCRQIQKVLNREKNHSMDGLRQWWDEYCGSCLDEAKRAGTK
jgi:hypothetical protein